MVCKWFAKKQYLLVFALKGDHFLVVYKLTIKNVGFMTMKKVL